MTYKIQRKNTLLALLVLITLFLASIVLLAFQTQNNTLRIVGTGVKDEKSAGTDIRIASIKLNNEDLQPTDVTLNGEWDTEVIYAAVETDESTWLEIKYKATDNLEVVFQNQEGSGHVEIYKNDELLEEKNLFSEEYKVEKYVIESEKMDVWEQVLPFISLVLGLAIEFILLSMIFSFTINLKRVKKYKFLPFLLLILGAVSLHVSVEIINSNLFGLRIFSVLENIILYLTAMLIVYILTARVSWAVASVSFAWLIFAVANYYVTLFRGIPLTLGDFRAVQTAANVASVYEYVLPIEFCVAFVIFVMLFGVIANVSRMCAVIKTKARVLLCIPVVILVLFITYSGVYFKSMNLWQPKENVMTYGLGVNMVSGILNMQVEVPDDYSEEETEKMLSTYDEEESDFNPNIIVIMSESFSDMSVFNKILDNNLYMSYYNSLQEDTIKGTVVSSSLGGQTANVEYEFLTGNSMFYLGGMYPYQQFVYKPTLSLPRTLKERGYQTIAIHPYIGNGYNRPSVYSHFSFDSYLDVDDFDDYEMIRDRYVSDQDSYEKVIEEYEKIQNTEDPAFIFNVTMQNHSVYTDWYAGTEEVVSIPGMEGKYTDVEEYLTLIKKSDQALSVLVDYFKEVEEPTILLLFGDHQPNFTDEFYEEFSTDLEYNQKKYEVPFLIWANYDIEEEENVYTSTNYLSSIFFEKTGVCLGSYQKYLLELRKSIPVITKNGYMDSNEKWHTKEESDNKELQKYWNLEYYHIFKNAMAD